MQYGLKYRYKKGIRHIIDNYGNDLSIKEQVDMSTKYYFEEGWI